MFLLFYWCVSVSVPYSLPVGSGTLCPLCVPPSGPGSVSQFLCFLLYHPTDQLFLMLC